MPDTVIKNSRIILGGVLQPAEIAVERGLILKVGKVIVASEVNTVIDAHGALVLPGAIDVHVHFRDPGYTHKEDWYSGSCAAAAGGVTTVVDQPNTAPPTLDAESFRQKQKAARHSIVDWCINAGVTRGNIHALKGLWELGALAFGEIFLAESTGSAGMGYEVLEDAFSEISRLGAKACVHAEDAATINEASRLLAKELAPESYSRMRPGLAEAVAITRTLEAAGSSGADVHISHVSTREGVGLVREAKRKKQAVTCEVTPHHLFLTDRDWARLGTLGKMNPPLRSRRNMQYLWNGLNDGTVDMVASDHAPHLESEKSVDIRSAPAGVPGVETMLPLMLFAAMKNLLPAVRIPQVLSENPAKAFSLRSKGYIFAGYDADLVVMEHKPRKIHREDLHSRAGWSPYEGMEGIFPRYTLVRGEVVWDGEVVGKSGYGRFIPGAGAIRNVNID